MFDRFTDNAIKVVIRAQEEARRLGHNYVGTEQILLGLIGVSAGLAGRAFKMHGIELRSVRIEVEKIIGRGDARFVAVDIPFTPRAKQVLNSSRVEADRLNETSIDTEHLLLGLLKDERELQGIAIRVLEGLGVDFDAIRETLDGLMRDRVSVEKTPTKNETYFVRASDNTQSYYELLQVDPHAEFRVILEAYTHLVKKYHPDSETGDLLRFTMIHQAWFVLGYEELHMRLTEKSHIDEYQTMYHRFSEKSMKALMLAQEESRRLRHSVIGTELLLLGLLGEGTGIAASSLKEVGVDLKSARIEVEKIVGRRKVLETAECYFSKECKRNFAISWEEAKRFGHSHVGPDHLWLGLLRARIDGSSEGGTGVLAGFGVDVVKLISKIESELSAGKCDPRSRREVELCWDRLNLYQILQVDPKAETGLIAAVHRYLSEKYHADCLNTGDKVKYEMINNAWVVLSDETKRVEYDATLYRNNTETS